MSATAPTERSEAGASADATPRREAGRGARGLPRWIRVGLIGLLFFFFFVGCPLIALMFPVLRLVSKDYRRTGTYLLNRGLRLITVVARFMGIVDFEDPVLPASVDASQPFVMICNHPTYVDMLLLLGSFPHMTCVTSGRWSRHWALGRLLRWTSYLPGPGSGLPESEHMIDSMVSHLKSGHALLVFPEGKRSLERQLRRFRRGAMEAATAADVPIVPLFLAIDRPYLTKQVPLHRPPSPAPIYSFEWFDVVRPAELGSDAKRVHQHLDRLYKARYAEQVALQESIRASSAAQAAPPRSRRS